MFKIFSKGDKKKKKIHSDEFRKCVEKMEKTRPQKLTAEEKLAKYELTPEKIEQLKKEGYEKHYRDGVYHRDKNAPSGSVDNPVVVGMDGVSNSLQFDPNRGYWILTDGLGNGWIR